MNCVALHDHTTKSRDKQTHQQNLIKTKTKKNMEEKTC